MRRPYPTRLPAVVRAPGCWRTAGASLLSAPLPAERALGANRATLLYSSDADHVGDVAVVDAPISEGDTDATSTR